MRNLIDIRITWSTMVSREMVPLKEAKTVK